MYHEKIKFGSDSLRRFPYPLPISYQRRVYHTYHVHPRLSKVEPRENTIAQCCYKPLPHRQLNPETDIPLDLKPPEKLLLSSIKTEKNISAMVP